MNTGILYVEASKRELLDKFLLNHPGYFYRMEDGKIDCVRKQQPDPPWFYFKNGMNQNCQFWHYILFDAIFERKKVPIYCQNCWKVVVMPRDLEELFACYALLHELNIPGKCGTEGDRPNTDRLYGAYFYNNSLEDGQECYEKVRAAVDREKEYEINELGCNIKVKFDKDVPVILKRGCTEFEQACGPSDEWTFDQEQVELERVMQDSFAQDVVIAKQGDIQKARLFQRWIHNAFQWGDPKYKLFTNGNAMYPPPVTYHDMDQERYEQVRQKAKICPR